MPKARDKARDLVRLAVSADEPGKEELAAAYRACKIISKYNLLASPLDGLLDKDDETVQAAASVFETLSSPSFIQSVKKIAGVVTGRRNRRR